MRLWYLALLITLAGTLFNLGVHAQDEGTAATTEATSTDTTASTETETAATSSTASTASGTDTAEADGEGEEEETAEETTAATTTTEEEDNFEPEGPDSLAGQYIFGQGAYNFEGFDIVDFIRWDSEAPTEDDAVIISNQVVGRLDG